MIDTLQKIAVSIRPLRYVALVLALVCLAALGVIVLGLPAASGGNRYLMPALVGFIWCLSAYGFIDTFQAVPETADNVEGFFARLTRRASRAWFWLVAVVFLAATVAAAFLTYRLVAVWLSTYGS